MVDDVVAAEVLEPLGARDHVFADHVVAHDADAEIGPGLDDALDRLGMGPRHHDDMRRAGLGHHLRLEIAAVHRLQIGDDRHPGKGLPQGADAMEPLGEDQRRPCLEPVDAGADGERRGVEGLVNVREVERDLDDRPRDRGAHHRGMPLKERGRGRERAPQRPTPGVVPPGSVWLQRRPGVAAISRCIRT